MKDVRSQGEGEFVHCGHFANKERRELQKRTSTLLGEKTSDFSKFMVSGQVQEKRGLSQCQYFVDKGRGGQFFAILCGHLSRTAPQTFQFVEACQKFHFYCNLVRHWTTGHAPNGIISPYILVVDSTTRYMAIYVACLHDQSKRGFFEGLAFIQPNRAI